MRNSDAPLKTGKDDYNIHLNFLPVEMGGLHFGIYRRKCASPQEDRPTPQATAHRLPSVAADEEDWSSYWVVPDATEGFEVFDFQPEWNADITQRIIFECLRKSVVSRLKTMEYRFPENSFIDEVSFVMQTYPEGAEELVAQPYSLKATHQTGFLVDFHFRLAKDVPFTRRIQQLSLGLDKNFRRNVDYCVDKSSKIRRFLEKRWLVFEGMTLPGGSMPLRISKDFVTVPAERLRPKVYVFSGDKESKSQFNGLRDFGPLQPLEQSPRLLFVFREKDRQAARRLALSLRALKQRGQFNFPGFKHLFKVDLEIDANPVVLPDLTATSMEFALKRAEAVRKDCPQVLPVIVLPNEEDNGYLVQKAYFSHAGMPTQVCTLRILEDEESLKWAIGNLALQIFCKAGGKPWKVRPTAERSLIIGISQSHKCRIVNDRVHVDKYFAFSVLTDSSGLFQQIQVLGDTQDHSAYISALRANLKKVLEENANLFNRVVIHTSFKLRHEEIRAIQQTTQEVAAAADRTKCRFSVIKVNHNRRFFGINRSVNSLVPYEATKVRLGSGEHLVWFEGIYLDKPNVTKAFPGPTHLQFLRVHDEPAGSAEQRELLQDLVNLSGANWRGFNAKSAPVSVFYCHLVADFVHDFHERGLPMPAVQDIRPWFL
ncbi:MAG: Piwi domain-containing protein [Terriglobia bacterium]